MGYFMRISILEQKGEGKMMVRDEVEEVEQSFMWFIKEVGYFQ